MILYKLKGELFDIEQFHVIDDVQYPVGWFYEKDNRDAMDITEEEVAGPVVGTPVPSSVTRRQARQALLLKGLLDKIEPAIESIPDATQRGLALIEWQDSQVFERSRPLLVQIGLALGLDSAGMDALFMYAATL